MGSSYAAISRKVGRSTSGSSQSTALTVVVGMLSMVLLGLFPGSVLRDANVTWKVWLCGSQEMC